MYMPSCCLPACRSWRSVHAYTHPSAACLQVLPERVSELSLLELQVSLSLLDQLEIPGWVGGWVGDSLVCWGRGQLCM